MILDLTKNTVNYSEEKATSMISDAKTYFQKLKNNQVDYSGWVNLPFSFDEELLEDIINTAKKIQKQCVTCIVVGIGGSFLGAKAVNDALNDSKPDCPKLYFAGYNMTGAYIDKLVDLLNSTSTCVIVISKSGRTVETLLSYSILKEKMFAKYGYVEARKRIYAITDANKGDLKQEAFENGYKTFSVPDNIGGRYSVLSVVGLLPIAVAGHDIKKLLAGAASIAKDNFWEDKIINYSVARNVLYNQNKVIEIFAYMDINLEYFGSWLSQLFGESEGKNKKGVFPTCLCFTRDLHSMGQFIQQGSPILFETMIRIKQSTKDLDIPWHAGYPYAGKTLETINDCAESGVIVAHEKGEIPMNLIQIEKLDEENMGQLIYFFEYSCAISAYLMGVDPFNQPGVEDYKREMKALVLSLDK